MVEFVGDSSLKIKDNSIQVKVKKNEKFKEYKAGDEFESNISITLFTDLRGNVYASICV